jgi:hypothetical protein
MRILHLKSEIAQLAAQAGRGGAALTDEYISDDGSGSDLFVR